MQKRSETSSKKAKFVNDELTCPFCDSYEVAEDYTKSECTSCGLVWVWKR